MKLEWGLMREMDLKKCTKKFSQRFIFYKNTVTKILSHSFLRKTQYRKIIFHYPSVQRPS